MMKFYKQCLKISALTLLFTACNTPVQKIFSMESSEKKDKPEEVTLKPKLKHKVSPDDKALINPLSVTLPYQETSYFESEEAPANGYQFSVKRGQRLYVTTTSSNRDQKLFTQLWEKGYGQPTFIGSAEAEDDTLAFDFDNDGNYIIRIEAEKNTQPYTVMITTGPSLLFPISKADKPRMSSFWGASRDNGARSHEGIDIVAKKHTPLLAVADGYIVSVKNGGLGGKTVSLRPDNKNYSVYYAHLDEQMVRQGQYVRAGDVIGTVGNTGNAAKTVPHLHFGIYSMGGAVDPFLFINPEIKTARQIKADTTNFRGAAKVKTATSLYTSPQATAKKTTVKPGAVTILAATDNYYRVRLEDGTEGFLPAAVVVKQQPLVKAKQPIAQNSIRTATKRDNN